MVVCLLARHAVHELGSEVLAGRQPGIALSRAGEDQARRLARRAEGLVITRIEASPQLRTVETARIVAERLRLPVHIAQPLDEVDFGIWTGRTLAELEHDPAWRRWNEQRSIARAPGGESMGEVQARITAHIRKRQRGARPGTRILMVSHAEPIRAAALSWMSLPLEAWWRIDIAPASVTRIEPRSERHALVSVSWRAAS